MQASLDPQTPSWVALRAGRYRSLICTLRQNWRYSFNMSTNISFWNPCQTIIKKKLVLFTKNQICCQFFQLGKLTFSRKCTSQKRLETGEFCYIRYARGKESTLIVAVMLTTRSSEHNQKNSKRVQQFVECFGVQLGCHKSQHSNRRSRIGLFWIIKVHK